MTSINDEPTYESSLSNFRDMFSGLQYDSDFESCVNKKLDSGEDDLDIQNRIANHESIKDFNKKDINYIKKKLRIIINIESYEIKECMDILNLGKSICQTGISDKALMIGSLIFSIIGNDKVDILTATNDETYKINMIIDELGPLVPQAINNIIKISKEYETIVCNEPSNTTLLLERLYVDLYDKSTNVVLDFNPYLDFSSLINLEPIKFTKTIIVLVVFSYMFMHATNLIVAFLSRGSIATKLS
jgi:hypothetical protein